MSPGPNTIRRPSRRPLRREATGGPVSPRLAAAARCSVTGRPLSSAPIQPGEGRRRGLIYGLQDGVNHPENVLGRWLAPRWRTPGTNRAGHQALPAGERRAQRQRAVRHPHPPRVRASSRITASTPSQASSAISCRPQSHERPATRRRPQCPWSSVRWPSVRSPSVPRSWCMRCLPFFVSSLPAARPQLAARSGPRPLAGCDRRLVA
jgi:hypothetical protein